MIKKTILFVLFLTMYLNGSAQDSLGVFKEINIYTDTILTEKIKKNKFNLKNYLQKGYPSPKKAVTLAVIPGLGQIYNKDYWKLPIVYLSLAGVIYSIDFNRSRYDLYRRIHSIRTQSLTTDEIGLLNLTTDETSLLNLPEAALKNARDTFDKRRQLSWMGLFGFYLVSAGEAFVDAHLKDFNVNDDISFHPNIQSSPIATTTMGVSIKIKLNK